MDGGLINTQRMVRSCLIVESTLGYSRLISPSLIYWLITYQHRVEALTSETNQSSKMIRAYLVVFFGAGAVQRLHRSRASSIIGGAGRRGASLSTSQPWHVNTPFPHLHKALGLLPLSMQ